MPPTQFAKRLLLSLFLLGIAGCANDSERYEITGTVKFKNQLLEAGAIAFIPTTDELNRSGAPIIDGKYTVSKSHGLAAGTYKVMITSGGAQTGDEAAGAAEPDKRDGGERNFDFNLDEK